MPERGIRIGGGQAQAVEASEAVGEGGDDGHLVAVLKVAADSRQIHSRLDLEFAEIGGGSDSRKEQKLGGVERSPAKQDLAAAMELDLLGLRECRGFLGVGVGLVNVLLGDTSYPEGLNASLAVGLFVEDQAGDANAGSQEQAFAVGRAVVLKGEEPVSGA